MKLKLKWENDEKEEHKTLLIKSYNYMKFYMNLFIDLLLLIV